MEGLPPLPFTVLALLSTREHEVFRVTAVASSAESALCWCFLRETLWCCADCVSVQTSVISGCPRLCSDYLVKQFCVHLPAL